MLWFPFPVKTDKMGLISSFQLKAFLRMYNADKLTFDPSGRCPPFTHISSYLLKNGHELLVLLALFPRWGRRRLKHHGATNREGDDERRKMMWEEKVCELIFLDKHIFSNYKKWLHHYALLKSVFHEFLWSLNALQCKTGAERKDTYNWVVGLNPVLYLPGWRQTAVTVVTTTGLTLTPRL